MFYHDDLKFLYHLLDRYFIWITKKDDLEKVRKIGEEILKDHTDCEELMSVFENIYPISEIVSMTALRTTVKS
ncbi:MAG TPA: hypothetical protein ENH60_06595 [Pricia sp.]|nr:hypothetical protein [Pricia sp.]